MNEKDSVRRVGVDVLSALGSVGLAAVGLGDPCDGERGHVEPRDVDAALLADRELEAAHDQGVRQRRDGDVDVVASLELGPVAPVEGPVPQCVGAERDPVEPVAAEDLDEARPRLPARVDHHREAGGPGAGGALLPDRPGVVRGVRADRRAVEEEGTVGVVRGGFQLGDRAVHEAVRLVEPAPQCGDRGHGVIVARSVPTRTISRRPPAWEMGCRGERAGGPSP